MMAVADLHVQMPTTQKIQKIEEMVDFLRKHP